MGQNVLVFFSRDSEAALGSQSATMGGLFWTRIRLGKAVAGPGVRGQDDRDKWTQTSFFLVVRSVPVLRFTGYGWARMY